MSFPCVSGSRECDGCLSCQATKIESQTCTRCFERPVGANWARSMCAECQKQVIIKFALLMEAFDADEIEIIDHALDGVSLVEVIESTKGKEGEQAARRADAELITKTVEWAAGEWRKRYTGAMP